MHHTSLPYSRIGRTWESKAFSANLGDNLPIGPSLFHIILNFKDGLLCLLCWVFSGCFYGSFEG